MSTDNVKSKINEKLQEGGSVGTGDFANFSQQPAAKQAGADTGPVPVAEGAKDDPIVNIGSDEKAPTNMARLDLHRSGVDLGINLTYSEIEITDSDKEEFLDCLIDNRRFTRDFVLFGGKITGVIRSRTSDESRALIYEAQRRAQIGEILSDSDYAAVFRRCTMRFQIQQLNSTEFPEPKAPLLAQANFKDFMLEDAVDAPEWYNEAEKAFSTMQTGVEAAIFAEIMKFEYKYWTMVENSDNQDFWNPGG
jgi:hypothetical protein